MTIGESTTRIEPVNDFGGRWWLPAAVGWGVAGFVFFAVIELTQIRVHIAGPWYAVASAVGVVGFLLVAVLFAACGRVFVSANGVVLVGTRVGVRRLSWSEIDGAAWEPYHGTGAALGGARRLVLRMAGRPLHLDEFLDVKPWTRLDTIVGAINDGAARFGTHDLVPIDASTSAPPPSRAGRSAGTLRSWSRYLLFLAWALLPVSFVVETRYTEVDTKLTVMLVGIAAALLVLVAAGCVSHLARRAGDEELARGYTTESTLAAADPALWYLDPRGIARPRPPTHERRARS